MLERLFFPFSQVQKFICFLNLIKFKPRVERNQWHRDKNRGQLHKAQLRDEPMLNGDSHKDPILNLKTTRGYARI